MIEINGTTWTDPEETHAAHEFFFGKYGKEVAQPACNFCGKTTCYIVEPAAIVRDSGGKARGVRPLRKGVSMMFRLSHLRMLCKGDQAYIPVMQCGDCEARWEAMQAFKTGNWNPPNLDKLCMTQAEKDRFRMIFRAKISDLEKEKAKTASVGNKYTVGDK